MPKVLVFEESDIRVRALERLLVGVGYQPITRVWNSAEDVWDALVAHDAAVGVVIWHESYPVTDKRKEMQELVDCAKPGLPVLAVNTGQPSGLCYFDSEIHSTNDFSLLGLGKIVKEHLEGTCAVCARYRS